MTKLKIFIGDKKFYAMATSLILPIVIQQIVLSIAGYLDGVMVNIVSTEVFTGVSTANKFVFVMLFLWIGISAGISIFISQYRGGNNRKNIVGTIQFSIIISIIFGVISSFIIYYVGPQVIHYFLPNGHEDALNSGISYVKVIGYGAFIMMTNTVVSNIFRALKRTKIALLAGVIGIFTNLILNYILIFGKLGAPAMGAEGAAIATVISKGVELSILIIVAFFFSTEKYIYEVLKKNRINKTIVVSYLKKGTPLALNEVIWALGILLLTRFVTSGNSQWASIYYYFQSIVDLLFVFFSGIANGTAIIIGSDLGSGDFKKAQDDAHKLIGLMFIMILIMAFLAAAFSPALLLMFVKFATYEYWTAYFLILINIIALFFFGMSGVIYFILRAGGDTLSSFILDQFPTLFIGLPLTFLFSHFNDKIGLGLLALFAISKISDVFKLILSVIFYKKGKWIRNLNIVKTDSTIEKA